MCFCSRHTSLKIDYFAVVTLVTFGRAGAACDSSSVAERDSCRALDPFKKWRGEKKNLEKHHMERKRIAGKASGRLGESDPFLPVCPSAPFLSTTHSAGAVSESLKLEQLSLPRRQSPGKAAQPRDGVRSCRSHSTPFIPRRGERALRRLVSLLIGFFPLFFPDMLCSVLVFCFTEMLYYPQSSSVRPPRITDHDVPFGSFFSPSEAYGVRVGGEAILSPHPP